MYEPVFNSVLVEIDDKGAEWGSGNSDTMLGDSYSKGKIIRVGDLLDRHDYPIDDLTGLYDFLKRLKGRQIMWNEGVEAGTVFEFDDKKFGFIYWWDIRGVLADAKSHVSDEQLKAALDA